MPGSKTQRIPTKTEKGFSVVIHKAFAELGQDGIWSIGLKLVEWGRHPVKFDIRKWDEGSGGYRSGRGITLTLDEVKELKAALDNIDLENFVMPEKKIAPIEE